MVSQEPLGERPDGGEVTQVEVVDLDPGHTGERAPRVVGPAGGDDHPGPCRTERAGRGEAEAGVAARDESRPAGEVDPGEDVRGRAVGTERGVGRVAGHGPGR